MFFFFQIKTIIYVPGLIMTVKRKQQSPVPSFAETVGRYGSSVVVLRLRIAKAQFSVRLASRSISYVRSHKLGVRCESKLQVALVD